jgi:hypothetical protein
MKLLILILSIILFDLSLSQCQVFKKIPTQGINFQDYLGEDLASSKIDTVHSFTISHFITYKEYKNYLKDIKRDSSFQFYISQRPDSGIAPKVEIYSKYVNSNLFDKEPVVGISWESAMNYCKWKTLKENTPGNIKFVYRIPNCKEWIAAYHHFSQKKKSHDMNSVFADWLLDPQYENWHLNFYSKYGVNFFHTKNAPLTWRRKMSIGNSYVFSEPSLLFYKFWYFANRGHRHLSFRIVKEYIPQDKSAFNNPLLKYWNLVK